MTVDSLDDTDWRILEALQLDGRVSYADLARTVAMSPSAVTEFGEGERGAGGPVAAGSPAVRHDRHGRIEEVRGPLGDPRGGQVQGAGHMALVPGLGRP